MQLSIDTLTQSNPDLDLDKARPETGPLPTGRKTRAIQRRIAKLAPLAYFILQYRRIGRRLTPAVPRARLFETFLKNTSGPCLQIAVKDEIGKKFGPNWISVDRFDDRPFVDRHDDVQDLNFPDCSFNGIVCWSVLEHVPDPLKAVSELYRVLKPGGLIWVQAPFIFPYHADPHDYWRVTPNGLRIWMSDFEEIDCGFDYWTRTHLVAASFFYGRKIA
jgi:SAM-dependent methyltransferase